jgi:antirestriction protein ArdC
MARLLSCAAFGDCILAISAVVVSGFLGPLKAFVRFRPLYLKGCRNKPLRNKAMSAQLRKQITEKIITALESNLLPPWRQTWKLSKNSGLPTSVATDRPYRGINFLLCQIHASRFGLNSKYWGTFKQWQTLGAEVKRRPDDVKPGEWGCKIILFKPVKKGSVDPKTGKDDEKEFLLMRQFVVFNLDQVSGSHLDRFRAGNDAGEIVLPRFDQAEELINATNADIRFGGDKAFYSLPTPAGSWPNHETGDYIVMPHAEQFESTSAYYETALHELSHWAEVRTAWDREKHGYPLGELIAEMSSCFVAAELGVPATDLGNHASYLGSWIQAMRGDPTYIFKAASQASKTADYLLSFVKPVEPVEAEEPAEQVA